MCRLLIECEKEAGNKEVVELNELQPIAVTYSVERNKQTNDKA